MTKPRMLHYDTLDDRREVHTLLTHLAPSQRIVWLNWILTTRTKTAIPVKVSDDTMMLSKYARTCDNANARLSHEVFLDFWRACAQYGVNADRAIQVLRDMVKRASYKKS